MDSLSEAGAIKVLSGLQSVLVLYRRHLQQSGSLPSLAVEQFVYQLFFFLRVLSEKFPAFPWDDRFPDFGDLEPQCALPPAWLLPTFKVPPPPVVNPFSMTPAEYQARRLAKSAPAAAASTSTEGPATKKQKKGSRSNPPAPPEEPAVEDPPKSVIKATWKSVGGRELRALPGRIHGSPKPAAKQSRKSSSVSKAKALSTPTPPPAKSSPTAHSEYEPSGDEEAEAEETGTEDGQSDGKAATSDGGPEDEDESAPNLRSHADYEEYNRKVHPTTLQRRQDEMPQNAPKLIPRALVITSLLPQPYQRAMFSCPTCITRNTRCIFYKWNMACWACSQGSMRCAFTHGGVEFMRVQDRSEPLMSISNSFLMSLLTTLIRTRRNLELHYSIVRKLALEYDQDLNDFAVHYFQAETVLPRHHFVSKFEGEDSVEMIQQLFDRLEITHESALAAYRARHPAPKIALFNPILPTDASKSGFHPLDFIPELVEQSDAASDFVVQPSFTEQAHRRHPPKSFKLLEIVRFRTAR
ncbi:hypothetical protein B0H11DRAFT_2352428 [Mycena galericulata]|nr:hypothetical protein B0H11DRAFT_2352428 [Mycena galericulata]